MPNRTIVIGDIHGCDLALSGLLKWIQPLASDLIVSLGDVIDRGPNSCGVIERLLALGKHCQLITIRGNHEELLLDAMADPTKIERWLVNGGSTTLKSYGASLPGNGDLTETADVRSAFPDSHYQFLVDTVPYYETDGEIFLHAGYVPDLPLSEQSDLALRWRVASRSTAEPHVSGKTVYVGHTPQRSGDVLDLKFFKCIDTNCYRGGWLTAVDVHSNQIWQVDLNGRRR